LFFKKGIDMGRIVLVFLSVLLFQVGVFGSKDIDDKLLGELEQNLLNDNLSANQKNGFKMALENYKGTHEGVLYGRDLWLLDSCIKKYVRGQSGPKKGSSKVKKYAQNSLSDVLKMVNKAPHTSTFVTCLCENLFEATRLRLIPLNGSDSVDKVYQRVYKKIKDTPNLDKQAAACLKKLEKKIQSIKNRKLKIKKNSQKIESIESQGPVTKQQDKSVVMDFEKTTGDWGFLDTQNDDFVRFLQDYAGNDKSVIFGQALWFLTRAVEGYKSGDKSQKLAMKVQLNKLLDLIDQVFLTSNFVNCLCQNIFFMRQSKMAPLHVADKTSEIYKKTYDTIKDIPNLSQLGKKCLQKLQREIADIDAYLLKKTRQYDQVLTEVQSKSKSNSKNTEEIAKKLMCDLEHNLLNDALSNDQINDFSEVLKAYDGQDKGILYGRSLWFLDSFTKYYVDCVKLYKRLSWRRLKVKGRLKEKFNLILDLMDTVPHTSVFFNCLCKNLFIIRGLKIAPLNCLDSTVAIYKRVYKITENMPDLTLYAQKCLKKLNKEIGDIDAYLLNKAQQNIDQIMTEIQSESDNENTEEDNSLVPLLVDASPAPMFNESVMEILPDASPALMPGGSVVGKSLAGNVSPVELPEKPDIITHSAGTSAEDLSESKKNEINLTLAEESGAVKIKPPLHLANGFLLDGFLAALQENTKSIGGFATKPFVALVKTKVSTSNLAKQSSVVSDMFDTFDSSDRVKLCDCHSGEELYWLGQGYFTGRIGTGPNGAPNYMLALDKFCAAAELGYMPAMISVAMGYADGWAGVINMDKARKYLMKSVKKGDLRACEILAIWQAQGRVILEDKNMYLLNRIYKTHAEKNHPWAHYMVAVIDLAVQEEWSHIYLEASGEALSFQESVVYALKYAVSCGFGFACKELMILYYQGNDYLDLKANMAQAQIYEKQAQSMGLTV
jgi:cell division protein ZapA (FtsZ GTPase activity inhibitor)